MIWQISTAAFACLAVSGWGLAWLRQGDFEARKRSSEGWGEALQHWEECLNWAPLRSLEVTVRRKKERIAQMAEWQSRELQRIMPALKLNTGHEYKLYGRLMVFDGYLKGRNTWFAMFRSPAGYRETFIDPQLREALVLGSREAVS